MSDDPNSEIRFWHEDGSSSEPYDPLHDNEIYTDLLRRLYLEDDDYHPPKEYIEFENGWTDELIKRLFDQKGHEKWKKKYKIEKLVICRLEKVKIDNFRNFENLLFRYEIDHPFYCDFFKGEVTFKPRITGTNGLRRYILNTPGSFFGSYGKIDIQYLNSSEATVTFETSGDFDFFFEEKKAIKLYREIEKYFIKVAMYFKLKYESNFEKKITETESKEKVGREGNPDYDKVFAYMTNEEIDVRKAYEYYLKIYVIPTLKPNQNIQEIEEISWRGFYRGMYYRKKKQKRQKN